MRERERERERERDVTSYLLCTSYRESGHGVYYNVHDINSVNNRNYMASSIKGLKVQGNM